MVLCSPKLPSIVLTRHVFVGLLLTAPTTIVYNGMAIGNTKPSL